MSSGDLPALHVGDDAKISCIVHLSGKRAVRVKSHSDSARSDESRHCGIVVNIFIVTMSKAAVRIASLYDG